LNPLGQGEVADALAALLFVQLPGQLLQGTALRVCQPLIGEEKVSETFFDLKRFLTPLLPGFKARMLGGTYFRYVRAPVAGGGWTFDNAEAAGQFLIHEQSVCCVAWDDAGPYLRFSVTYLAKDEAEEDALMAETVARLGRLNLQFE
jgi:hypothetical protein